MVNLCIKLYFFLCLIVTALIKEVTNQRPHPLAPLHITQNTPTGGILSNNLATKIHSRAILPQKPLMQVKKKCFFWINFFFFRDIQNWHCIFFQIGCEKKTLNGHFFCAIFLKKKKLSFFFVCSFCILPFFLACTILHFLDTPKNLPNCFVALLPISEK